LIGIKGDLAIMLGIAYSLTFSISGINSLAADLPRVSNNSHIYLDIQCTTQVAFFQFLGSKYLPHLSEVIRKTPLPGGTGT